MATDVTMPRLSDSMEEGTILKWIVEEGGEGKRGEPLCEIETDKANMTYEADTDGVLVEIVVAEGETVALGEVIARVGSPDEKSSSEGDGEEEADDDEEPAPETEPEEPAPETQPEEPDPAAASNNGSEAGDEGRAKAPPVARRVANELGIDIADVQGTGPGGRILKADVEKAADEESTDGDAPEKAEKPKKEKKPKKDKKQKMDKAAADEDA